MTNRLRLGQILFAHQSVGANILQGLAELPSSARERIPPLGSLDDLARSQPVLASVRAGRNREPLSKLVEFAEIVRAHANSALQLAALKFCYVDVGTNAEAERLFDAYVETIEALRRDAPAVCVAHVTMPLRSIDDSLRGRLRRLAGRDDEVDRNSARAAFNAALRAKFRDKDPFFDLAAIEATTPEGALVGRRYAGQTVPELYGKYTFDGGHLNELGRRICAQAFVAFLRTTEDRLCQ